MDATAQGQDSAPYEDGDYSTGTVADYEDWLDEDGESHADVPPIARTLTIPPRPRRRLSLRRR